MKQTHIYGRILGINMNLLISKSIIRFDLRNYDENFFFTSLTSPVRQISNGISRNLGYFP